MHLLASLLLLLPFTTAYRPADKTPSGSLLGTWSLISTTTSAQTPPSAPPRPITVSQTGILQLGKLPSTSFFNVTSSSNRIIDATSFMLPSTGPWRVAYYDLNMGNVMLVYEGQVQIGTRAKLLVQNRNDCFGGLPAKAVVPIEAQGMGFCEGRGCELLFGEACRGAEATEGLFFVKATEDGGIVPRMAPPSV